jgi:hypothetical protein
VKHNILADGQNKKMLLKNSMREKIINRKNVDAIRLPNIFSNKQIKIKDKSS